MKIHGWTADESGCAFYRVAMPSRAVEALFGDEISVGTGLFDPPTSLQGIVSGYLSGSPAVGMCAEPSLGTRSRDLDVVIGQRVCNLGATRTWQRLAAQALRPRLVFEVDDDLWNIDPANTTAYRFYTPEMRSRLSANVAAADLVTVSTEALAEVVRAWNRNVVVLPNCVPRWPLAQPPVGGAPGSVVIGWAGSPTHAGDWAVLAGPLGRFLRHRRDAVELHTIGTDYAVNWTGAPKRHTPWAPTVLGYYRLLNFDIGLAPLADTPFNASKSHIKALEYAARGIPIVASAVGPYRDFVQHERTGYLVHPDDPSGWYDYLDVLVNNPGLRREMGAAARELAREHLIDRWAPAYRAAWTGLAPASVRTETTK